MSRHSGLFGSVSEGALVLLFYNSILLYSMHKRLRKHPLSFIFSFPLLLATSLLSVLSTFLTFSKASIFFVALILGFFVVSYFIYIFLRVAFRQTIPRLSLHKISRSSLYGLILFLPLFILVAPRLFAVLSDNSYFVNSSHDVFSVLLNPLQFNHILTNETAYDSGLSSTSLFNRVIGWQNYFILVRESSFNFLFGFGPARNLDFHPYFEVALTEYLYRYGLIGCLFFYYLMFNIPVFKKTISFLSFRSQLFLLSIPLAILIVDSFSTLSQQPKALFLIPIFFGFFTSSILYSNQRLPSASALE